MVSNAELDEGIKSFFQSDDFYDEKKFTDEEEQCEQNFQNTHSRNESGQYIVCHGFVNGMQYPDLGDSRKGAVAQQLQLEKRFPKFPKLKCEYQTFINEFITLGRMELANNE